MDKEAVLGIVDDFGEALERRGIHISKMILYGSYARGNYHEGSDIDLVVVSDDFADIRDWPRVKILAKAVCDVWEPIEAVAMTNDEWERGDRMIAMFAREGEVVYDASRRPEMAANAKPAGAKKPAVRARSTKKAAHA